MNGILQLIIVQISVQSRCLARTPFVWQWLDHNLSSEAGLLRQTIGVPQIWPRSYFGYCFAHGLCMLTS